MMGTKPKKNNLAAHVRVELLVPRGEQGGGDIQPLPIQAQLCVSQSSSYWQQIGMLPATSVGPPRFSCLLRTGPLDFGLKSALR